MFDLVDMLLSATNDKKDKIQNSCTLNEKILRISPHSVRTRENTDQNNSEYGHFLRSGNSYLEKESLKIRELSYRNLNCYFPRKQVRSPVL